MDDTNDTPKWIFRNGQWGVTDYGMDTTGGPMGVAGYPIPKRDLLDLRNGDTYHWVEQVCEKTWADCDAFAEAFEKAAEHHHPGKLDRALLRRSVREARL